MFKEIEDDKELYDNVSIKEIIDDDFKRIVFVYTHMYVCGYTCVLVAGRWVDECIRLPYNVRVLQCSCYIIHKCMYVCVIMYVCVLLNY